MSKFKKYQRIQIAELRPVTDEEVMSRHLASNISMSMEDKEKGHPYIGDMVARNPENHNDQWLVTKEHFKKNFKPIDDNKNVQDSDDTTIKSKMFNIVANGETFLKEVFKK